MTEQSPTTSAITRPLRRWWWIVAAGVVIGAVAAFAYTSTQPSQYQATASLHFTAEDAESATSLSQGAMYTQSQMLSYAQLAEGSAVLQPVIDDLGLEETPRELAESVDVEIPPDTVVLQVTVSSGDPQQAADTAGAIAEQLVIEVQELTPSGPEGETTVSASVVDEAVAPEQRSSPDTPKWLVVGAGAGGMIAAATLLAVGVVGPRRSSQGELPGRRADR